MEAWDWPNTRYEHDSVAQFTLVLDGVEEVVGRLGSPEIGQQRLALIVADYLADILLARRVQRMIELSELHGGLMEPRERFDSRTRGTLRSGFKRRLAVAARSYERRFTYGAGDPILTASDAEVLRVAHAYRNDIYHEDRHNERTLLTIARAAIHAVARAWKQSLPSNVASSSGARGPLMDRLLAKGYETPRDGFGGSMLSLHAGAETVCRWLAADATIDLATDTETLGGDIHERIEWAQSMLDWLSGSEGPGRDKIEPALHWHEFWRDRGADPEWLELDEARAVLWSEYMEAGDEAKDALTESMRAANEAYEARWRELMSAHRPKLALSDLPKLDARGAALGSAKDHGALLARYLDLDLEVRVFEETLLEIATGWERAVEAEEDRRRGK
jgi:hypothetical protein